MNIFNWLYETATILFVAGVLIMITVFGIAGLVVIGSIISGRPL